MRFDEGVKVVNIATIAQNEEEIEKVKAKHRREIIKKDIKKTNS